MEADRTCGLPKEPTFTIGFLMLSATAVLATVAALLILALRSSPSRYPASRGSDRVTDTRVGAAAAARRRRGRRRRQDRSVLTPAVAAPAGVPAPGPGRFGTARLGNVQHMASSTSDERPVAQLVHDLSQQTATLVRQELRLAQLEMQQKGKKAGVGIGLFGGAGAIALYGVGVLIAAAVLALSTAMDSWLAATIVAVVLFLTAGVAALVGKGKVRAAGPPVPEQAISSTQRDLQAIKQRSGRA